MKYFYFILFSFQSFFVFPQNNSVPDSLETELKNSAEDSTKIALLNGLFEKYKNSSPEKAFDCAEKALATALKTENTEWIIKSLSSVSLANYYLGNYDVALSKATEGLSLSEELGNEKLIALSCGNIAIAYTEKGDYKNAIDFHLRALKIRQELGDKKLIATSLNNLGFIYEYTKNFDKALEFYSSALNIFREINFQDGITAALSNTGLMLYYKGNYNDALNYFLESLSIDEKMNNKDGIAGANMNIGNIYFVKNDFDKALKHYRKSLEKNHEMGLKEEEALSLINIGMVYEKKKKFQKAIEYFQKGNEIYSEIGAKLDQADSYKNLSDTYSEMKNFEKAFENYRKYSLLKDSVLNENSAKHLNEMQTKYETEKKEKEIEIQHLKINEQQLELNQRNIFILVLSFGIILLISIGILLYRQQKLKQKQIADKTMIEQQELRIHAMIEGEEKERKRLAQELHDGLGQMLSTVKLNVSGLEKNVTTEKEKQLGTSLELIDDACNELRNISHNLMPSALIKLGLIPALKEFTAQINQAGNLKIHIQTHGIENRLNNSVETGLYRIIQELFNNIIKYSKATKCTLQLIKDENQITTMIEDDGIGFDINSIEKSDGIGWKNIKSRVLFLNGNIDVDSHINRGTTVTVEIPNV